MYSNKERLETSNSNNGKPKYISKTFSHFIKTININSALRGFSENPDHGVLNLTDEVKQ